ncbi:MAG: threonine--tRNA ligase [Rickettsiales bacterium]|nr:threonine--tRNA ligase [Rickettsiales bacterium]
MVTKNFISLTLPDGKKRKYEKGVDGFIIAKDISLSLSKQAVAMKINGLQRDLCDQIYEDSSISIITINSKEGLEIMRHTLTAQVLARAVKNIFSNTKLAIGPTIDDGFYYDFLFENPVSTEDFFKIEEEMKSIISKGYSIKKKIYSKNDTLKLFEKRDEKYKLKIIQESEQDENFQIYEQGDTDFIDLCRGPHLPNLGFIGEFKLTKLAGAYWRGNSKNEMLQRIYGTAWLNKKDLEQYLNMIEEAEKRDHRKLGKELKYFHFQEDAPGSVFWHPKGWKIYTLIMDYMRGKLNKANYHEVNTPLMLDRSLWEASGHWDKFREQMFTSEVDEKILAIKPMNCPCHVQIFKQGIRSYKELPFRMSEFGCCHRNEPSGALHGLLRVRAFTQDDAHIFCSESQIKDETEKFCNLLTEIYKDFGFEDIRIKFSDRPEKRAGDDSTWDQAEDSLLNAIKEAGYSYELNPGEGAFYGPKLEFILRDAIGREWQCGTLQVDFVLPQRLDASYVSENGEKKRPVMLHRAILGSFERFIGILLENNSGKLPNWLSPVQIVIVNVNDDVLEYSKEIKKILNQSKFRCQIDTRNEKINYKIREHSNLKIPYILVLGKKELENRSVSVRVIGSTKVEEIKLEQFLKNIKSACSIP